MDVIKIGDTVQHTIEHNPVNGSRNMTVEDVNEEGMLAKFTVGAKAIWLPFSELRKIKDADSTGGFMSEGDSIV